MPREKASAQENTTKDTREIPPKKTYKKSAITRGRVYRAAVDLMNERGYQGATIRDICQRAHVSPATFYSYFDSKIAILRDIYAMGDQFINDHVIQRLDGKTPREQLLIFASGYAKLNVHTGFDTVRVLYNPENEWFSKRRQMQDVLYQIMTQARREKLLRADMSVPEIVDSTFIVLRGVCFAWCVYNGGFDLEQRMVSEAALLWDGLTTKHLQ